MACPDYDRLHAEWKAAHWKYIQTLNPDASTVLDISAKLADQRVSRRELLRSERNLNIHIAGCAACLGDGHKPIFDSFPSVSL
jgi:hypothetical protein